MQAFESFVLRSEAALGGDVDNQHDRPGEFAQGGVRAGNCCYGDVVH